MVVSSIWFLASIGIFVWTQKEYSEAAKRGLWKPKHKCNSKGTHFNTHDIP